MAQRFSEFTFHEETRQLFRSGEEVHVSPKCFDLLSVLLANRARAVSKAELQERLWPATFVDETNLATLIAQLRRALRDSAENPRFIRTIYGFGYQFVGEVEAEGAIAAEPRLPRYWLVFLGRQMPLLAGVNVIGRAPDAAIQIDAPGLSRRHARIVISSGVVTLEDLGSKNGTRLNERLIDSPSPLTDGDEIRFGPLRATFRVGSDLAPTETVEAETP